MLSQRAAASATCYAVELPGAVVRGDRLDPDQGVAADPTTGQAVLVETKLLAPPVRDQMVRRDTLLERLNHGAGHRLTLVACPAGFGKTSLLADWYQSQTAHRAMAWLTIDKDDNDPAVLWSYILEALRRVCPDTDGAAKFPEPEARLVLELLLPRLVNALAEQPGVSLILDDFHMLTDGRARESIHWLIQHAPPNFQLVLSTRKEPDLSLATLRAHGDLLELRVPDLRFTASEAARFLNDRQLLGLTDADVERLIERTDGWPAGVALAALSLRRTEDRHALISRFGASNRHVIDFLESEVLDAHDPADRGLLMRCSVLGRLSGPLCDWVLERTGSAQDLIRLSRSNLFLVPLDDRGGWYQFHPLFAQLLHVELERQEPSESVDLHRRAFEWYRELGDTTAAIGHAIDAGMEAQAADLVAATWFDSVNSGRYETVLAWIDRFPADLVNRDVRLLLVRAWSQSLTGMQDAAAVTIARIEPMVSFETGPLPDGFSSAEASLATLRGAFPWGNVGAAYENALRAFELEGPDSPWRAGVCWGVALARLSRGEYPQADALFAEVVELSAPRGQWLVASTALSYRSVIAGVAGRIDSQAQLAEDAVELAHEHGLANSTAGPPMAMGLSLTARGRAAEARPILEHGVAIARAQGQPLLLVRTLRYLADALDSLGEHQRAAAANAEARSILAACVDSADLRSAPVVSARPSRQGDAIICEQLTHRELTVLNLLAGDLSEAKIGQKLFVSHSTVHSHVKSIYRKLGVSSRSEAIESARDVGYLQS